MTFSISIYILPLAIIVLLILISFILKLFSEELQFIFDMFAGSIVFICIIAQIILGIIWLCKNINLNITS